MLLNQMKFYTRWWRRRNKSMLKHELPGCRDIRYATLLYPQSKLNHTCWWTVSEVWLSARRSVIPTTPVRQLSTRNSTSACWLEIGWKTLTSVAMGSQSSSTLENSFMQRWPTWSDDYWLYKFNFRFFHPLVNFCAHSSMRINRRVTKAELSFRFLGVAKTFNFKLFLQAKHILALLDVCKGGFYSFQTAFWKDLAAPPQFLGIFKSFRNSSEHVTPI